MPLETQEEDCAKIEYATCLQTILQILARETVLNLNIWNDIIEVMGPKKSATLLTPVFITVIQTERVELIELFSSYGFNPFSRAPGTTAPAIFGLVKEPTNIVNFKHILKGIFNGMEKYYMSILAGLKEYDLSASAFNNACEWEHSGTLLDKAVKHNSNLAHYLIKHSNPRVGVPLHWAVVLNKKALIKDLIHAGLSPYEEGSLYLSKDDLWEHPSLTSRFLDEALHDKKWNINVDPDQLTSMLKEPISDYFYDVCKNYLTERSSSLEVNVGSDVEELEERIIKDFAHSSSNNSEEEK